MFDTLADRIKVDEPVSRKERILRICAIVAVSVVLFGGLYLGVQYLEG